MMRIRRIYDDILPANKEVLNQLREIMQKQFRDVSAEEIDQIGEKLRNPFKQRFRSILFVAESQTNRVQGFALLFHEPEIKFCYLDWIATRTGKTGGGLGGALYDTVRRESADFKAKGLFFECLPDDPKACSDHSMLRENRSRLRFYERYGARPIVNTAYETPVQPGDTDMPYLVYDGLGQARLPDPVFMQAVVRAILERKYAGYCPPDYVKQVVQSFKDCRTQLRDYRYVKAETAQAQIGTPPVEQIGMVLNDRHTFHHVHERGYVESPARIRSILKELEKSDIFFRINTRSFPEKEINAVHDRGFTRYLRRACEQMPKGESLYPYVFPIRNKTRPPIEPSVLSGYYCIDTFTPINHNAYLAARRGVDCALTAAQEILNGRRISYALVRPPGHHAERRSFGGFCYFNNGAIAAQYLCPYGRVAMLDIDYHHGNGQQDIFYNRADVLTVSIHGHPRFAYPYFSGFEDEHGEGEGEGHNLNIPLAESVSGETYQKALRKALQRIETFDPYFLVVSLGLDTAKDDPTGTWSFTPKDFETHGRMIGELGVSTLVVQEGGYKTRTLGVNARRFFRGMILANQQRKDHRKQRHRLRYGIHLRYEIESADAAKIHHIATATGFFNPAEVDVAEELVHERLTRGPASGYHFILAEHYSRLIGYVCYGPIAGTLSSYDLYWIAVDPDFQGRGLGAWLVKETEQLVRKAAGTRIYIETSQRGQYAGTRTFYEDKNYRVESVLDHFYRPGEAKVTFCKALS